MCLHPQNYPQRSHWLSINVYLSPKGPLTKCQKPHAHVDSLYIRIRYIAIRRKVFTGYRSNAPAAARHLLSDISIHRFDHICDVSPWRLTIHAMSTDHDFMSIAIAWVRIGLGMHVHVCMRNRIRTGWHPADTPPTPKHPGAVWFSACARAGS